MSLLFQALRRMEGERDVMASHPPLEADEFLRGARLKAASKSDSALTGPNDEVSQPRAESAPPSHTFEWPHPAGNSGMAGLSSPLGDPSEHSTAHAVVAVAGSAERPLKLTTPQIPASPAPPLQLVPPTADLVHMKSTLAELNTDYRELRDRIVTQNSSLKRVGHHLEKVREATRRNTHELREWIEELKGAGSKITFVAVVAFALLGISVIIDIIVYLHAF